MIRVVQPDEMANTTPKALDLQITTSILKKLKKSIRFQEVNTLEDLPVSSRFRQFIIDQNLNKRGTMSAAMILASEYREQLGVNSKAGLDLYNEILITKQVKHHLESVFDPVFGFPYYINYSIPVV